jgi:hypothetical protein
MANPTSGPKNPKQSAKTKRASQETAAAAKARANSEKLKLAARERKSPGRGPIPSGSLSAETKVPKQKRQAYEAKMTQYNKQVKKLVKSSGTKASDDIVVARNKSGGKKPFSKGTYGPTGGTKVPVKPKGRGGLRGGGMGGGGLRSNVTK